LNQVIEAYAGDIVGRTSAPMPALDPAARALAEEAAAIFQTADDLYMTHRYAVPAAPRHAAVRH
jgi:hypothetical protein